MSFMPGELVRRAAAGVTSTVSSTVSTVASVASGKKRHDSAGGTRHSFYEANLISNAKEKYTMTVKCTPNKDASTTADLAVKSGFLMKRNEQGAWQKRFMCIVPHMYLYYFDSEVAEAPRGIIDLELYQHTEREEGAGIQLVAADDSLRSFHFNDDDEENLNEWATSLIRDRYHLVCEERNAYQQMQSLMTGAIDNASSAQKSSEKEREQLEKQLSDAENLYLEARRLLQTNLFELGISDEEMSQLTDVTKLGICLKNHIADMRSSYERKVEDLHEIMNSQQTEYGKMTEEFLKKMENEQLARKNLEALILKERKESEKKVKEAEAQIDNITLNFQMAVAAKTTSETKANTLNEQKKLLVKEVKQLRKRVDELSAANDELKSLNDRLLKAANALQFTVKSSNTTSPKTVPTVDPTSRDASVLSPTSFDGEVVSTNSVDEGVKSPSTNNQELEELLSFTDQLIAKSEQLNPHDGRGRSFDSNTTGNADEGSHTNRSPPSSNPVYRAMNMFRSNGSDTDLAEKTADRQHSDEKSRNNSIVGDDYYEERPSWEMPPMALRELGWLSEEQNKLMEKRYGDVNDGNSSHNSSNPSWTGVSPAAFKRTAQDEQHVEEHRRGSTLSMFTGLLGSSNADSNSSPHTSGRRSSLMAITSMFNKKEKGSALSVEEGSNTATNVSVPVTSTTTSKPAEDLFFSSPFTTPNEEEERLPTAMRLHCLRCNGSVEGPKFSTCKCSTPALTPDDLNSDRLSSLTGIFKGGLFKATGLYSSSHGSSSSNNQGVSHNSNEISL